MKHTYDMSQQEVDNIVARFGQDFYDRAVRNLAVYGEQWGLSHFKLIPHFSASLVFTCHSAQDGEAVLKIGHPNSRELATEYYALDEYNGNRFCKVYQADLQGGVFLEEYIQPGDPLRNEPSLDIRLAVFCDVYQGLHIPAANLEMYPAYKDWVYRITNYMSTRHEYSELYLKMKRAKDIFDAVSTLYTGKVLLHGDLHHGNMLTNSNGGYTLIDPKGVIGDPIYDTPRFILNEFENEVTPALQSKISHIISTLASELNIPSDILKQCLYVEMTMAVCWCVEDGADDEFLSRLMESITLAELLMES
ncbi:Aminoglycoside/hydroxyurea antibiotic resistance kinase [compost metagenome]